MNLGLIVDQGEAGASSEAIETNDVPNKGKTYSAANGFITSEMSWLTEPHQWPAFIWKRYQKAHRLRKIGFRVGRSNNWPDVFEVVGSDDCSTWTSMLRLDKQGPWNGGFTKEFRTYIIPVEKRTPFKCIGLKWPGTRDEWLSQSGRVSVDSITMWEDKSRKSA